MDWRVLAFSMVSAVATGVIFGLVPSLQATKPDLVSALKDTTSQSGFRRSLLRNALVVLQVAFSVIFLIAAGLTVRALQRFHTMSPGFNPESALVMSVDLGLQGYEDARKKQFYEQMVERVRELPGVRAASVADFIPLSLNYSGTDVHVEGQPPARGANLPISMVSAVGVGYFETMQVPLVAGRAFNEQDNDKSQPVAIVNETFARRFFPGPDPSENAIGKRISFDGVEGPFMQIAGVAKDGKYFNIGEDPRLFVYQPMLQVVPSNATLIVRTWSDPNAMIAPIREEVQKLDASLPVFDIKTMSDHMSLSLFPARVAAAVLGAFGLVALVLAAIGIYGVTAYSVAQRTREIGIRMALGARAWSVLMLVLRQGMVLVAIGLAIGLSVAVLLTRLMSSLLYGVSATDMPTYAVILGLLAASGLAACLIPARRASSVDPITALRYD